MLTRRFFVLLVVVASLSLLALPAFAGCRISNETKYDFTVTSGNTSNQRVTSHSTMTIAAGKIVGESKEGKTISGSCKERDTLVITMEGNVPVLAQK